jgi:hypothetical protein
MEVFMDAMRKIHERDEAVYQLISQQLKEMIMPTTDNQVQAYLDAAAARLAPEAIEAARAARAAQTAKLKEAIKRNDPC